MTFQLSIKNEREKLFAYPNVHRNSGRYNSLEAQLQVFLSSLYLRLRPIFSTSRCLRGVSTLLSNRGEQQSNLKRHGGIPTPRASIVCLRPL